jgi:hypothetical protein
MSQQMHYDEAERPHTPIDSYDPGYQAGYRDPFTGASGQKISFSDVSYQANRDRGVSAGQRLALAIVSVVMLVPIIAIIMGTTVGQFFSFVGGLIALALVCVTIMVINVVFNHR